MNKICYGCGCILQSDNELNPGYIPSNKIDTADYCKRCFRLTHYGSISNNDIEKSTKNILDKVNKDNIYKIYIVDILNINNDTIEIFNKIKGNKLFVISKIDLVSNSMNINNIINNIKKIYDIKCDIKYISSNKEFGINSLLKYLENNKINIGYILGPTNSGKSTLSNKLIDMYDTKLSKLTISNKRNTTLEFIKLRLSDKLTIIDSPGFLINDYGIKSKYKNIIKPITFNMKKDEVLNIDKFYIKFSNSSSVTIYTYDSIYSKKYYKDKNFDYDLDINDNTDLCINGFGILRIKNKNSISISNLDKQLVSVRMSMFGGNYE